MPSPKWGIFGPNETSFLPLAIILGLDPVIQGCCVYLLCTDNQVMKSRIIRIGSHLMRVGLCGFDPGGIGSATFINPLEKRPTFGVLNSGLRPHSKNKPPAHIGLSKRWGNRGNAHARPK